MCAHRMQSGGTSSDTRIVLINLNMRVEFDALDFNSWHFILFFI